MFPRRRKTKRAHRFYPFIPSFPYISLFGIKKPSELYLAMCVFQKKGSPRVGKYGLLHFRYRAYRINRLYNLQKIKTCSSAIGNFLRVFQLHRDEINPVNERWRGCGEDARDILLSWWWASDVLPINAKLGARSVTYPPNVNATNCNITGKVTLCQYCR